MWINTAGLGSPVVLRATLRVVQPNNNMLGRQNKRLYFRICEVLMITVDRTLWGIFWWKVQVLHQSGLTAIVKMMDVVSSRKSEAPWRLWLQASSDYPWSLLLFVVPAELEHQICMRDERRKVRPCRNLGGNRYEARSNAAASSPYWWHLDGSP